MATLFGSNVGNVWLQLSTDKIPHRAYRTVQKPHKHEVYQYFGIPPLDDNEQVLYCVLSSLYSSDWSAEKGELSPIFAHLYGMPSKVCNLYKTNQPKIRIPAEMITDEFPCYIPAHYFEGVREETEFDLGPLKGIIASQISVPRYHFRGYRISYDIEERVRRHTLQFHDRFEQLTKGYNHTTDKCVAYLPRWTAQ